MREENIEKMNFKELRAEVQALRDELALFKRKYEDTIYNLDDENFGSHIVKEKRDMKAEIKVTAEEISSKVSKEDFVSKISQTAEKISSIVSEYVNTENAVEVESPKEFLDISKVYLLNDVYYHYNTLSDKWEEVKANGTVNSLFEQTSEGFNLRGDVVVDGSCIVTSSLKFNSEDNPVQVEYSANGTSGWHTGFVSGTDKFMRLKIGATWSDAMKVVGDSTSGGGADIDAQTVFNMLTSNGGEQGLFPAFYGDKNRLFINAEYIKTGTLKAEYIDTDNLMCTGLYAKGHPTGYSARLNGSIGDFGIFKPDASSTAYSNEGDCIFGVRHEAPNVNLFIYGHNFIGMDVSSDDDAIWPKGVWNFSACSVLGLPAAIATFG